MLKNVSRALVAGAIAISASVSFAGAADAAAYTKGAYAPYAENGRVVGWADVNTDCEGTFGCYTYVKIEALNNSEVLVVKPWEYAGGGWAKNGWNKVAVNYRQGCTYYKTVVDTYNDAPGDAVLGVNIGVAQVNLGGGLKRYHKRTESSSTYLCLTA